MTTDPLGRATRQRAAVKALLEEIDDFASAQLLHRMLQDRGESIGLTTVYRTLNALAEAGDIDVIRGTDGEASFRRCSTLHHHHLVCRSCGRTVEVTGPAVEHWAEQMATEYGFSGISHTLELFGTCPECSGEQQ